MVMAIQKLDDKALAKVMYQEQVSQGWPGLAREVQSICEEISLPDVNLFSVSKNEVKAAIDDHHKKDLLVEMKKLKKLG